MVTQEVQTCPECKNHILIEAHLGQATCTTCGLVIQERDVDIKHHGRRTYNTREVNTKHHYGDLVDLFDMDLSTFIRYKKDQNYPKWVKLVTVNNWKFNNSKSALFNGGREIKRIRSALDIPYHTAEMAMLLYRKAKKADLIKGRSVNGMVDACIYYACRKHQLPISYLEILNQNDVKHHHLFRCYYALTKEFNLNPGVIFPKTFIARYCSELGIPMECEKNAMEILDLLPDQYFSGKDPKGIIAGLLYLVSKTKRISCNQEEISKKMGITSVTLRSRCRELKEFYYVS